MKKVLSYIIFALKLMGEIFSQIKGFSSYLPPNKKLSEDTVPFGTLPRKIDFKRLTGIVSHHEVIPNQGAIELAVEASKLALERSKVPVEEIDLVISCSVSRMSHESVNLVDPCLASQICTRLNIKARNFDITNACLGMVTGLMIADQKIKAGKIRNALIVSGEHLTPIIEEALSRNLLWNHKAIASLTVGDAGGAYVISHSEQERIKFFEPMTLAQHCDLCIGESAKNRQGPAMRTSARKLQYAALDNLGEYMKRCFNKPEDLESHNHIIPHQTTPKAVLRGAKIIDSIWGLGDRVHSISHSGNTASTSHTVALDKLLMEKKLKNDEKVYFISFGSGLGMLGISLNLPKEIEAW